MSRVQINCEVVYKTCFTHMLNIWTVIIIIRHTITIKVIDTYITNSLCCREILKTQIKGCEGGALIVLIYLFPGFMPGKD